MVAARAILTARGGMTSHAAVVARGMGKCCVVGCKDLDVDESAGVVRVDGRVLREGEWITVDGSTGRVILGQVPLVPPGFGEQFERLMGWADELRVLRVRTNADTPADARRAREYGAEGIGLCRTEHMFFEGDRIRAMREMIVATDLEGRRRALLKLLPMQRDDFVGIFRAMDGLPVTIRLLDPPLHEFLPHDEDDLHALGKSLGVPLDRLRHTVEVLTEANPMLGHRGCRLGITFPEITEMQAQAIFEAACQAAAEGIEVYPEVMIPLVAHVAELDRQVKLVRETAERVFAGRKQRVAYLVGTMIELPRAAVTADEISEVAEFFSFGTNDLTQTTLGLSRDDAGRFLPFYIENGILADDPVQTLDQAGVGKLISLAVRLGRERNPDLKIGICGEHGGDPRSVEFCHQIGLNYVSCSPFRVPIARLAAAHAALAGQPVYNTD
jgi:pyruvate,orthophosphate dikinase